MRPSCPVPHDPSVEQDRLDAALGCLKAGALAQATRLCTDLLVRSPALAEGLATLALARQGQGDAQTAERLLDRALAVRPDYPKALTNRAVLRLLGHRTRAALADATAAAALNPALSATYGLRARILFRCGDHAAAVDAARHALDLGQVPGSTRNDLLFILVDGLRRDARCAEAETACRRFLWDTPDLASLWGLLAMIRHARGHWEEAAAAFRRSVALEPAGFEAALGLADTLINLGNWRDAPAALSMAQHGSAISAAGLAQVWHWVALAAQRGGNPAGAIHAARKAVRLQPAEVSYHGHLGTVLAMTGQHGGAEASFRRTLGMWPGDGGVLANFATTLVAEGRMNEAATMFGRALSVQPEAYRTHSNLLFTRQYQPDIAPARHRAEHRAWYERHAAGLGGDHPPFANRPDPERRLRVGLVSADLGRHPVGYFLAPFLEAHDRAGFALIGYSSRACEDAMTADLKRHVEGWRRVESLSDEELAGAIRADGIDILIDLSGHTAEHRLLAFARCPAPVQVTWLGYVNTTGMPVMDAFVGGGVETPPGAESWFEERLLRLPHGRFCYRPPDGAPPVVPPPLLRDSHEGKGRVTFGSFNTLAKLSPPVVALWARVVAAVPDSRLLLKARPLGDPAVRRRVRARFAEAGLAPDRLVLRPWSPYESMLAEYGDLDIALDPFPFSGGLTSCEALWMGVPAVTLPGETLASRQTAAFLTLLGLPELVAGTPDAYVAAACALAQDPDRLAALRAGLRERMRTSPLLDGPRFARALEGALRDLWRGWCRKQGNNIS